MNTCSNCGSELNEHGKFCPSCGEPKKKVSFYEKIEPTIPNMHKLTYFLEANLFTIAIMMFIVMIIMTFVPFFGWLILSLLLVTIYLIALLSKTNVLPTEKNIRSYMYDDDDLNEREIKIDKLKKQLEEHQELDKEEMIIAQKLDEQNERNQVKVTEKNDQTTISPNEYDQAEELRTLQNKQAQQQQQPHLQQNVTVEKGNGCAKGCLTFFGIGIIVIIVVLVVIAAMF